MYANSDSERIKAAVTVTDVLRRYHKLGRCKGRTSCPIHGGTHDNLGYTDKAWHCFTCGASGDVIGFAMQLFGLSFKDAVNKIAYDFGISLNGKGADIRQIHKQSLSDASKRLAQLKIKREHEKLVSEYWEAFDEYARLDVNKRDYAPKTAEEIQNPLFIEAMQNIGYATYRLSEADGKLNEFERANNYS